jgi:hypothetical protein
MRSEKRFETDGRVDRAHFYSEIDWDDSLEILADWPMSPENRAGLDDVIWAIQSLALEDRPKKVVLVAMDWDTQTRSQHIRERSMSKARSDMHETQLINNIFQGPSLPEYPGDSAIRIKDAMTIQLHKIQPLYDDSPKGVVAGLALLLPPNTRGFISETK